MSEIAIRVENLGKRAATASRLLRVPALFHNGKLRHYAAKLAELLVLKVIKPSIILFPDRNGLTYFLYPGDDWLYEYAYWTGYQEVIEQEFCKRYVDDEMTVIDVGAYYGQYALLFSKLVPSGYVHAFEPSSYAFQRLAQNLALNHVSNVLANHTAVSHIAATVSLHIYPLGWSRCNSLAQRRIIVGGKELQPIGEERVETVTLDEYCRNRALQHVDLLKIDVEGGS